MILFQNIQNLEFFSSRINSVIKTTVVASSEYFTATRIYIFHLKISQMWVMNTFQKTLTLLSELNLWESLQYLEFQYLKPLED